jgi:Na+-driven multidrug efflux pump
MLKKLVGRYAWWIKGAIICITVALCNYASIAAAADSVSTDLAAVATNITSTSTSLANILQTLSLIIGICFIMAGIFKAHQHKNNPTQITFGHALTLIVIGAALILFPYLLKISASALLGTTDIPALGGSELTDMLGGGS